MIKRSIVVLCMIKVFSMSAMGGAYPIPSLKSEDVVLEMISAIENNAENIQYSLERLSGKRMSGDEAGSLSQEIKQAVPHLAQEGLLKYDCLSNADREKLRELLGARVDGNIFLMNALQELGTAVKLGHVDAVQSLVRLNTSKEWDCFFGATLRDAVFYGYLEIVLILLAAGPEEEQLADSAIESAYNDVTRYNERNQKPGRSQCLNLLKEWKDSATDEERQALLKKYRSGHASFSKKAVRGLFVGAAGLGAAYYVYTRNRKKRTQNMTLRAGTVG